jgi:hypothetical protein
MRKLIAVDPGWGGAIAYYIPEDKKLGLLLCPGDCLGILDFLSSIRDKYGEEGWLAVLENNHSSPIFGARGNFGLGLNIGSWETALSSFSFPIEYVEAKEWQKATSRERSSVKKGRKAAKEKAWRYARKHYPEFREKLGSSVPSLKNPRQGMADALCILECIRRKEKQNE